MPNVLKELTGEIAFPIYYEDTDFSGYVYHANYLKYFERAREHAIGIQNLKDIIAQGYQYVVRKADLTYKAPTTHGDEVLIQSSATVTDSPRIIFRQDAYSKETGKLLVEGLLEIVCISAQSGLPARMPAATVEKFGRRT